MNIERRALDYQPIHHPGGLSEPPVYEPPADFSRIWGVIRRRYPLAIAGMVAGLVVAFIALQFIQPSYRSSVRILLDQDRSKLLTDISGEQASPTPEAFIATQIAVISSDIVARRVAYDLGLTYDPATERLSMPANAPEIDKQARVSQVTSEFLATSEIDPATAYAVRRAMSAYPVEKSLVMEITASDPDPELAQKLAAAYGRAYLTDQLSARFEATKSAGSWLEERINTLRDQSLEANAEVDAFRKEHNLVSTDGRLVSEQQLAALNDRLVEARTVVARSQARVDVFKAAVDSGNIDEIISVVGSTADIGENAPIRSLRENYVGVSQRARDVAARWGEDNDQAQILQTEKERQGRQVLDEARRILAGFEGELNVAQKNFEATEAAVTSATGQSQTDNSVLVALRGLEQRSASYNALYQDYLARYQEAVQQQTLSVTAGRLISTAELPGLPIFPNEKIVFALALLLGAAAGGGIGVARELMDGTFRSRRDIERLGVDFLGYLPEFAARPVKRFWRGGKATNGSIISVATRIESETASLNSVRIGVEIRKRSSTRLIGMMSLERSRSRAALALALSMREARSGRRVLLIDGDRAGRALSQVLASAESAIGGSEAFSGRRELHDTVVRLHPNMDFLPADKPGTTPVPIPADLLKAWAMDYDMVVVDLPPAGLVSEARSLAPAMDGYVCAVEWGHTPRHLLVPLLRSSPILEGKLIGAVITEVNMRRQYLYDSEVGRQKEDAA